MNQSFSLWPASMPSILNNNRWGFESPKLAGPRSLLLISALALSPQLKAQTSETQATVPAETSATSVSLPTPSNSSASLSLSVASAEGVTKARYEDAEDATTRGKFGVTMFTLGGVDDAQVRKYTRPSYSMYDSYISFNYKLTKNVKFAARPAFGYASTGTDFKGNEVTAKATHRDFSFVATQYNVFEDSLPSTMELKQAARLYLPTSDGSKAEGMIARLRYELEAVFFTGKYDSVRAWFKPSYYFQRTTAYLDDFGNTRQTRNADDLHGLEYNFNLNKMFSVKPGFEIEEKWSFSSDENQCGTPKRPANCDVRRSTQLALRLLALEVRPMKAFNFTIGLQDQRDLINSEAPNVVSYSLLTNITLY